MVANELYKYLDVDGALKMLRGRNLQFTNATQLNDPFDCHPDLIDFKNVPDDELSRVWGKDRIALLKSNPHERLRDQAWLCCLSKVYDSPAMWAYYGNHKGVCIGLDMTKTRKYLENLYCEVNIGTEEIEVQYKEIVEKPDCFHSAQDLFRYQLGTKAKDWEHEQEVRLVLREPSRAFIPSRLPRRPKRKEVVDYKEIRFYPRIGEECFDSLYLGMNIRAEEKDEIVTVAKRLNPNLMIYQIQSDPAALKLEGRLV